MLYYGSRTRPEVRYGTPPPNASLLPVPVLCRCHQHQVVVPPTVSKYLSTVPNVTRKVWCPFGVANRHPRDKANAHSTALQSRSPHPKFLPHPPSSALTPQPQAALRPGAHVQTTDRMRQRRRPPIRPPATAPQPRHKRVAAHPSLTDALTPKTMGKHDAEMLARSTRTQATRVRARREH